MYLLRCLFVFKNRPIIMNSNTRKELLIDVENNSLRNSRDIHNNLPKQPSSAAINFKPQRKTHKTTFGKSTPYLRHQRGP